MIRYTFFILTIAATVATAYAAVSTTPRLITPNTTLAMTSDAPVFETLIVESCALEDCSDTPSNIE